MAKARLLHKDVTCPFCSLLCDDLVVAADNDGLRVLENGCARAKRGFERAREAPPPSVRGKQVSLDEAVGAAAKLLRRARRPLITGLGSDVAGSRAAMLLAERTRGVIDHCLGDAAIRNILVLQERGWINTTLTELKNRADFILFVGTDAVSRYPRFFERYVWNASSLFLEKNAPRHVAYLGQRLNTRAGISPAGTPPLAVNCPTEDLAGCLSLLLAMVKGDDPRSESMSRRKLAQLRSLAERLRSATYAVLVWAPGDLDVAHGELIVEAATEIVRELNLEGRAAGLPLAGDHGTGSFMNVCAWQSGFPLRVSYAGGFPEYDPFNYAAQRLLARKRADALLWVAGFGLEPPVPETSLPTVVLGGARIAAGADVFIPVGTPGVDHPGNLFRTDSVVSLPLKAVRESPLPSAAAVLNRIIEALPA